MRKYAHRFREGNRPGSGIGPDAFTKTRRKPWETGLGILLTLTATGCVGPNFLTELVTYEVQVRDLFGTPVAGAIVTAEAHTVDRAPAEGRTDDRGQCALEFRQSVFVPRPVSEMRSRWLTVTIQAEGYEVCTLEFQPSQFIEEGDRRRRAEAIVLKRKQS